MRNGSKAGESLFIASSKYRDTYLLREDVNDGCKQVPLTLKPHHYTEDDLDDTSDIGSDFGLQK